MNDFKEQQKLGELSDEDLEKVAGGKGGVNNKKTRGRQYTCNHVSAMGTFLTVNNSLGPGNKTSKDTYIPVG